LQGLISDIPTWTLPSLTLNIHAERHIYAVESCTTILYGEPFFFKQADNTSFQLYANQGLWWKNRDQNKICI